MPHTLPPLPYAFHALEPHLDALTMEIHYTKHHQTYVDKLNAVLEKYPKLAERPLEDLLRNLGGLDMDEQDKTALRNNGGGHVNHSLFWNIMGPAKEIDQALAEQVAKTFGSIDNFKKQFTETALARFGSGWAWLVRHGGGELEICSTQNQDSPLMTGHTPVIGLDVWEHAYYLKYQNRRAEYIENWWKVLKLI